MSDFKQRVIEEQSQLEYRLNGLTKFLDRVEKGEISVNQLAGGDKQLEFLVEQEDIMKEYNRILKERINLI